MTNTPSPSEQPWRERNGRVVLLAARRKGQHALHFPPLPALSPLAADSEIVEIDSTATLYSFTVVHTSPKLGKPPQPLGYLDFPEGVRIFGRLDLPVGRAPVIGEHYRAALTEGEQGPIYAFRPENAA